MKILLAGCSFVADLTPVFETLIPGCEVTNVATWAAGNRYIADSVVLATARQQFDLIYVSWSGLSRYDVPIEDIDFFSNPEWQTTANLFGRNYVFTGGIGNWDYKNHAMANLLFTGYHKLVGTEQLHYNSILEIVKTQGYLCALAVPYVFTSMVNQFRPDPEHILHRANSEVSALDFPNNQDLINKINFDQWVLTESGGTFETCRALGMLSQDRFHPTTEGYTHWVNLVLNKLKQEKILQG